MGFGHEVTSVINRGEYSSPGLAEPHWSVFVRRSLFGNFDRPPPASVEPDGLVEN